MSRTLCPLPALVFGLLLTGCASTDNPLEGYEEVTPAANSGYPGVVNTQYPAEQLDRGRYMVELLGCGNCHTDGALIGEPDPQRLMAGSSVGIAWTNPLENRNPGVVFPANLTPDPETGIGDWSLEDIVAMLVSGIDRHGSQSLPVMPWQAYSRLEDEDARAIAMYLKSLPPVRHEVPANVRRGQRARSPFVHFGIYRSQQ